MSLLVFFEDFCRIEDKDQAYAFLTSHPILTDAVAEPDLSAAVSSLPPEARQIAEHRLHVAQSLGKHILESRQGFPLGDGPVERLQLRWNSGEISETLALKQAASADAGNALAPLYVDTLCAYAEHDAHGGDWRSAVQRMRLLLAALDARTDALARSQMQDAAVSAWLEVATRATADIPDGRIFFDAKRRGEAIIENALGLNDAARAARFQHQLGVLHLDPYVGGRSSAQFHMQIQSWFGRLDAEYGLDSASWGPPEERTLPDVLDGLELAIGYFRAAEEALVGDRQGRTLKALAEALLWREIAGGAEARKEVAATARRALALVLEDGNEAVQVALKNILAYVDDEDADDVSPTVEALLGPEAIAEDDARKPAMRVTELGQAANHLHGCKRYGDAVLLLDRAAALARKHKLEADRRTLAVSKANVLSSLLEANVPGIAETLAQRGAEAAVQAIEGSADPEDVARMLIGLAAMTSNFDLEKHGHAIIQKAIAWDPELERKSHDFLLILLGNLSFNEAVNCLNDGRPADAITNYMQALRYFVAAEAPEQAVSALNQALDLLDADNNETGLRLAVSLAETAVGLESIGGVGARQVVARAWAEVTGSVFGMGERRLNAELLALILQGAKGGAFASAWDDWKPVGLDADARALLDRIQKTRKQVVPADQATDDTGLDEHMLLSSFLGAGEGLGGNTAEEVLENLQVAFDARIERELTPRTRSLETIMQFSDLQKSLDKRAVLIAQLNAKTTGGEHALFTICISDETCFAALGKGQLPPAAIEVSDDRYSATMDWFGLSVSAWRSELLSEPGPADLTPEAEEALGVASRMLLGGGMAEHLTELRKKGKDHIVVAPHAAFHFFPFHLLPLNGRPLAEDWAVTALPNLCLLRRHLGARAPVGSKAAGRQPFAALGLGFENGEPHGLSPLPKALEEVGKVAGIFGTDALVDSQATETSFVEALKSTRILHLASHGRHRVAAPAFQAVYLFPDQENDGLVEAWELLRHDLEGLALVGLSACESALGRVDIGDNIRGLPAALLLAGTESIVGTLWEVESGAAQTFFEEFYRLLAENKERRDAFGTAMRKTRTLYPAYRDWGAFYLLGEWGTC
ncbi:CHAT domain-containing protein [Roseibium sp.]|uniref:CHAT domain-containing protein n=1 Tax=Roseibium sp. TaxID=1936156 RepID=UPI003BB21208